MFHGSSLLIFFILLPFSFCHPFNPFHRTHLKRVPNWFEDQRTVYEIPEDVFYDSGYDKRQAPGQQWEYPYPEDFFVRNEEELRPQKPVIYNVDLFRDTAPPFFRWRVPMPYEDSRRHRKVSWENIYRMG